MVTGIIVQVGYLVVFGARRVLVVPPQGHPFLTFAARYRRAAPRAQRDHDRRPVRPRRRST